MEQEEVLRRYIVAYATAATTARWNTTNAPLSFVDALGMSNLAAFLAEKTVCFSVINTIHVHLYSLAHSLTHSLTCEPRQLNTDPDAILSSASNIPTRRPSVSLPPGSRAPAISTSFRTGVVEDFLIQTEIEAERTRIEIFELQLDSVLDTHAQAGMSAVAVFASCEGISYS